MGWGTNGFHCNSRQDSTVDKIVWPLTERLDITTPQICRKQLTSTLLSATLPTLALGSWKKFLELWLDNLVPEKNSELKFNSQEFLYFSYVFLHIIPWKCNVVLLPLVIEWRSMLFHYFVYTSNTFGLVFSWSYKQHGEVLHPFLFLLKLSLPEKKV